jgi:acetylornithine/succinyldiaminopimelate/putrescine aminotransferase
MKTINLINDQSKEYAQKTLENFYQDQFISPEKKTYLTNLKANYGPYLAIESGKKDEPHYLLDAASQIATLGLGFSAAPLMGTAHQEISWLNDPHHPHTTFISHRFQELLKRKLDWCHLDATYCHSGAEANEIALGYAYKRRVHPQAKKVLAFEGSFHGRMMVSLFSTWNKSKREPFQWPDFETVFTDYPEIAEHDIHQAIPNDWKSSWQQATRKDFKPSTSWSTDEILKEEVDCLLKVREQLLTKSIYSIMIEPMQCEGGDRYSSDRFHTALLLMARSFQVPVIYDEVQTGFHLGTKFFWHKMFNLTDAQGIELSPDYLVCAKKAQIGLVLAPTPLNKSGIEVQQEYSCSSMVRGYLHALALDQSRPQINELQRSAREQLDKLVNKYSEHLSRPRAIGLAFAFDVKDSSKISEYIAKRFDYGLLYYPAGATTLRFRLNTAFTKDDLTYLFDCLDVITASLFSLETKVKPQVPCKQEKVQTTQEWQHTLLTLRQNPNSLSAQQILEKLNSSLGNDLRSTLINQDNFNTVKDAIVKLEEDIYEHARQTSIDHFEECAQAKHAINIAIHDKNKNLVAICFASSLNTFPLERGLRQDPCFNDPKSLYVMDTTVAKSHQGLGIGTYLKASLVAIGLIKGYHFIKGRNRDQMAGQMLKLNLSLGAIEENHLREDYPDFEEHRDVSYYGIPLTWQENLNLSNRQNSRLSLKHMSSTFMDEEFPYIVNKVCLSNFVSNRFLTHMQEVAAHLPQELRHCYSSSGQSECTDKVAKSLLYHFKDKLTANKKMVTFEGHYFGHGSFMSRSLSQKTDGYFPTAHLEKPTKENQKDILKATETMLKNDEVFALWLEPVLQKTLEHTPKEFIEELLILGEKYHVPVIFNETASAEYTYDQEHYFASSSFNKKPQGGYAYLGGQAGFVFTNKDIFIEKPLMMISTWDGDEYSLGSYVHTMRELTADKAAYLKIESEFHQKISKAISEIEHVDASLHRGRGIITGPLPTLLANMMTKAKGSYLLDPSYQAMKDYLARG